MTDAAADAAWTAYRDAAANARKARWRGTKAWHTAIAAADAAWTAYLTSDHRDAARNE